MKTKNKTLALVLALMLALTVCPISGFAAESVDGLIIDDVTGSQVATAITADLSLPAGFTWSSSDSEVISIGEEAEGVIPATVTRAVNEDKEVTLTASDGASEKSFNLIVKAKSTQIVAASSYADGENTGLTNVLDWDTDGTTGTMPQDTDGNYYFQYDFTQTDGMYDRYRLTTDQAAVANKAEILNIEYDFKYDQKNIVDFKIALGTTAYQTIRFNKSSMAAGMSGKSASYNTGWNHLSISVDTYKATLSAKLNDTVVVENGTLLYNKTIETYLGERIDSGLTYIAFQKGASKDDTGYFCIDNLVISAQLPEELEAADQKAYIEGLLWSDLNDEEAGAVTSFEKVFPTAGGFINWSSDNAAIAFADKTVSTALNTVTLGKTATVTRPEGKINTNAVITATHKDGAEYGEKKFYVSVLPEDYVTDFTTGNNVAAILADFEEGSDGESIELKSNTVNYVDAGVSGWNYTGADNGATVVYALDAERGMTAKISGAGKNAQINMGAVADIQNSATTGFDMKLNPGETSDSGVKISLYSAINDYVIQVCDGKVGLNTDTKSALWYTVNTSDWLRLDVDTNLVSRTSDVYINGVKLNEEPLVYSPWHNVITSDNPATRYVQFDIMGSAECFVDNLAVTCATNKDLTLAEAGAIWAKLYKDGITVTESTTLPQYGPEYAPYMNLANGTVRKYVNSALTTDFVAMEGATLTWSENGKTVTEIGATKPFAHSYTVTSTSGSESVTTTIDITEEPVRIEVAADGTVTVTGNTDGGTLIVATMDGDKLADVKAYTSFEGVSVAGIASYKIIFIDSFANLAPLAFEVSK